MLPSRRGFRVALGALALSALLGAPAAQAAPRHGSPMAAPASSLWQQAILGIEARIAGVLRLIGSNGPGSGAPGRALAPGATASGGSQSVSGSSPDQSGGQDPNG
jgi:hypothetical protein